MKGRTLWIAVVLAVLCLFVPGAVLMADDGQAPAGFWCELLDWVAALVEGPEQAPPESLGDPAPSGSPDQPEVSILIPPGG